jgi:hypothetical protein
MNHRHHFSCAGIHPHSQALLILELPIKGNEMGKQELLHTAVAGEILVQAASSFAALVEPLDSSQSQRSPGSRFAPQHGQV